MTVLDRTRLTDLLFFFYKNEGTKNGSFYIIENYCIVAAVNDRHKENNQWLPEKNIYDNVQYRRKLDYCIIM